MPSRALECKNAAWVESARNGPKTKNALAGIRMQRRCATVSKASMVQKQKMPSRALELICIVVTHLRKNTVQKQKMPSRALEYNQRQMGHLQLRLVQKQKMPSRALESKLVVKRPG